MSLSETSVAGNDYASPVAPPQSTNGKPASSVCPLPGGPSPTVDNELPPPAAGSRSHSIERFLRLLHSEGVYEIRILKCPERRGRSYLATASGYFDANEPAKAAKAIEQFQSQCQPPGIYVSLNPVRPDLIARAANRIAWKVEKGSTTTDDIVSRRWIMIDIDPIRESGISATNQEAQHAITLARKLREYLTEQGWPTPLRGMSGNGAYLLYRCEIPNDELSTVRIQQLLKVLARRFDTAEAQVDTTTFNASRIAKVLGTWARKGDHIDIRPHRQSFYIVPDGKILPVSWELLEQTAQRDVAEPTEEQVQRQLATVPAGTAADSRVIERCRKYLQKLDPAIAGQGGHNQTLEAAATGARFAIDEGEFRPLLDEYNVRCDPPWTDAEIEHKLTQGYEKVRDAGDWGKHLRTDRSFGSAAGDSGVMLPSNAEGSTGVTTLGAKAEPYFKWITAAELDAAVYEMEYLIPSVMASLQAMIFAGGFKTCKTTAAFDAGISLASCTPFLNTFDVPKQRVVVILTAESGAATVQETCRRICRNRGISLGSLASNLIITEQVPRLENPSHMKELSAAIKAMGAEVVIADPAYLMIDGTDAGNLFSMGDQLRRFADVSLSNGATPILLHHAKKTTLNVSEYQPLELGDIAWAGFAEFARQWMLISRRERYQPGTGEHRLWLSVGGSAGHNGLWGIDIAEGSPDDEGGRRYEVSVADPQQARELAAQAAEERKESARLAKTNKTRDAHRQKVIDAFRGQRPAILTAKDIGTRSGLSGTAVAAIVAYMLQVDELAIATAKKANRSYRAVELQIEKISQAD